MSRFVHPPQDSSFKHDKTIQTAHLPYYYVFVPQILIHFEMLPPCRACCSREPQIFKYVDTMRSGIPQASAIAR